ncbi:MAG: serine/threonine-protein kinase [Acidimicrobiales bacterium]
MANSPQGVSIACTSAEWWRWPTSPVPALTATLGAATRRPALNASVDRIGNYRVERVLGAGSFATVWLAVDEILDAKVAIKVLADNWSRQPDIRRRFIDEAKILRRLDDDRVVRVHQVDEMADGRPFFVMTWADGATLFDRIQEKARAQQPFSVTEAVELTVEIARCLEVVHGFGVVHRDIKPSNVLFRSVAGRVRGGARRDAAAIISPASSQRMMLGDFGLAKDLAGASGFTFAAGTPAYMAPEQARSSTDIDERADVFSVAAVLYELLAGRPAFSAETLSGVGRSHPGRDLEPLATARPDAPAALWQIIRRGLAPAREARIGSAEELLEELLAVGGPVPTAAVVRPPVSAATVTSVPPSPVGPLPPPLPLLVVRTLQLLDELAERSAPAAGPGASGGSGGSGGSGASGVSGGSGASSSSGGPATFGVAAVLAGARRRLLDPVQVMVVGAADGTTSELAWALAGEQLSWQGRGRDGRLFCRLRAAPATDWRDSAVLVDHNGVHHGMRVRRDAGGELVIEDQEQGSPRFEPADGSLLVVSLVSPTLAQRSVIDAGPLLDGLADRAEQDRTHPAPVMPAKVLAEADLLAVILPPSVEAGRAVLARLKERLRASPSGPVLAMGVVSPGPGSTMGGPGSVPEELAELVAAFGADLSVTAQLSAVSALRNGRAPMLDAALEALVRHSDAVRVTAALAQAEDGLAPLLDPGARAAFHGLRDGWEVLVSAFPVLEELTVLREEASGRLTLPGSYRQELRRLLAGGDPAARLGLAPDASGADLRRAAETALERWRTFVNTGRAPFASIHASQTVVRALERLWTFSQQRA